jgi:hypothetical protein
MGVLEGVGRANARRGRREGSGDGVRRRGRGWESGGVLWDVLDLWDPGQSLQGTQAC